MQSCKMSVQVALGTPLLPSPTQFHSHVRTVPHSEANNPSNKFSLTLVVRVLLLHLRLCPAHLVL